MLKLSIDALMKRFEDYAQGQVFEYYDTLTVDEQNKLRLQAESIDLEALNKWLQQLVVVPEENLLDLKTVGAASYIALPKAKEKDPKWQAAFKAGEAVLREGMVAVMTVAGGQGTRLGFKIPKGQLPLTPVREKCLFQIFAEKILAAQRRYGVHIPWYIMTSVNNHAETLEFLKGHRFFGLEHVTLMMQDRLPCVDKVGKILMENAGSIAMSPNGHGGVFRALCKAGVFEKEEGKNIQMISYHQVDNPLARIIDPYFIGFHILNQSEMSSKMVEKKEPDEKVGIFCEKNGKLAVIEYSDLPKELAHRREQNGQLSFRAGNIALHLINKTFVQKMGAQDSLLPLHKAHKRIKTLNAKDEEDVPNGYKFELFVFDALSFAKNALLVETGREEEFSPIKNSVGENSLQTCQRSLIELYARWLESVGVHVPRGELGEVLINLEISPLFAEDENSFKEKWLSLTEKPKIVNDKFYLD